MKRSTLVKAIEALRNTTATQIRGYVNDGRGGYCAVGVLGLAFGITVPEWVIGTCVTEQLREQYELPALFIRDMNDFDRKSFAQIAKYLEVNGESFVTEEDMTPDFVPDGWNVPIEAEKELEISRA